MVYQVLKAPSSDGVVYTIAPVAELHRVRQVHRDLLKAQVGSVAHPPRALSLPAPAGLADSPDSPEGCELWLLARETSAPLDSEAPALRDSTGSAGMIPVQAQPHPGPSADQEGSHLAAAPSSGQPDLHRSPVRRTGRSTAGQHSNVHRLPQPVGIRGNGAPAPARPVVNVQSVVFRPWS